MTPTQSFGRRIRAYDKAVRVAKKGRSITEISNETGTPDATIRGWLVTGRKPWTRYELFKPNVLGSINLCHRCLHGRRLDFPMEKSLFTATRCQRQRIPHKFSSTCVQVLGTKPYSVRHVKDRDNYETIISNASFCKFLERGLTYLDRYVREHPSGFVRRLADSDGCPAVTTTRKRGKPWFFVLVVVATSTSIRLLGYTRTILKECLGIKATLVYKGKPRPNVYKNKLFRSKKRVFDLRMSRFGDVKLFSRVVGFELARKREKLAAAIAVRERFGSGQDAVKEWTRRWEDGTTEWILKRGVD